jgi:hypothetical protein
MQTFFSTDVIKYQNPNNNGGSSNTGTGNGSGSSTPFKGSYSGLALQRWLEVTLPLTFITLAASWLTFYITQNRRRRTDPAPTSLV